MNQLRGAVAVVTGPARESVVPSLKNWRQPAQYWR